ncbi:hypothetical protein D3C80_1784690 [compost metagenome]
MDTTEIHRRLRHAELSVVEFFLPLPAQLHQFAHDLVHGLERTVAQAWVRRMATAAENIDAFHHYALVQANRLEPGRLADHGSPAQWPACFSQGPGT